MRKLNSELRTKFISEKGNDKIHKTYVAYTPLDQFMCIAVSESYDNDTEINSAKLAVETVLSAFEKKPSLKKIKEYIKCANDQILLHSTKNKLKVSITVIVSDYTRMRYGSCGNTKLHIFYGNMLSFVSDTQTKYQQLLDQGKDAKIDNAEVHNLTQYLGMGRHVRTFLSPKINLTEGSTLLLSTSNLWGMVSDVELLDAYEVAKDEIELLDSIQELLLSTQEMDGIGSYTAAAISIEKTFKEDTQKIKKRKKLCIIAAVILLSIVIIGTIVILIIRAVDRDKMSDIKKLDQKGIQYIDYGNYARSLAEYEKAEKITDKLSLKNWQYIDEKKELKDKVEHKLTMLTTMVDGEACIENDKYEQARELYKEVLKEARYIGEPSIYTYASEKVVDIDRKQEIDQLVAFGEMYEASEDYSLAIDQYKQALEILKETKDIEKRGEVQTKIYDATQKIKEAEAAAAAKKEEQEQEKAEKENKKINQKVIKIQVLLASANKILKEGNIKEADKIYGQVLTAYNGVGDTNEEVEKLYSDIVKLEQAIAEANIKEQETKTKESLLKAEDYLLKAAEAEQKEDREGAIKAYKKALAIYKKLKIWDDQVAKIYDDIGVLQQELEAEANVGEADPQQGEIIDPIVP